MRTDLMARGPDGPALVGDRNPVSRRQLRRLVTQERDWLLRTGLQRVGLLADNGVPWAIADLALLDSGLLAVPLPHFFAPAQLRHAVTDAGLDAILTDCPESALELLPGFHVAGASPASGLAVLRAAVPRALTPLPPGTVRITYTSGTTGTPRGVCLTAESLLAVASSVATVMAASGSARHLCLLPLTTLLENVAGLYGALLAGSACVLPGLSTAGMARDRPDTARLLATMGASEATSVILVPELLRVLVTATEGGWQPPGSLRFAAVGGAPVSPSLLARAAARELPVYEGYGLSECGSVVCLNTPDANRPGSVGRPLPHATIRVAADGEVMVRGAVMAGYIGAPAGPAEEWPTGDVGELDTAGYLHIRGRRRNVLITSLGRNVSPEWVERELQAEPVILRAMVVGDGQVHLSALLDAIPGTGPQTLAAAVARANRRLPGYARVRRFAVVPGGLTAINGSTTANGRLRREPVLAHHAAIIEGLYAPAGRPTATPKALETT